MTRCTNRSVHLALTWAHSWVSRQFQPIWCCWRRTSNKHGEEGYHANTHKYQARWGYPNIRNLNPIFSSECRGTRNILSPNSSHHPFMCFYYEIWPVILYMQFLCPIVERLAFKDLNHLLQSPPVLSLNKACQWEGMLSVAPPQKLAILTMSPVSFLLILKTSG